MKNLSTGFLCTCLLVIAGNLPGRAQEKKPNQQALEQTAPTPAASTDPAQPPASPVDTSSSSADPQAQQQPPATPQQTPPASSTPQTGQTPVPPPAEEQPAPKSIIAQPPPPPPKVPDVRRPGESGFWVGVEGWFPTQQPEQFGGKQNTITTNSTHLPFEGKPKYAQTVEAGLAVGLHNQLKFTFTNFRAAGDFTTPVIVSAFGQTYSGGTYISTNYHVQRASSLTNSSPGRIRWAVRRFRLKTLWQVQYTNVSAVFDSPLNYFDSNGNLILDSTGHPVNLSGAGTKHIFSPEFGLGFSYYPSRHVRIELNGSGFGFPHRYLIWDGDVRVNYRR